MKSTIKSIIKKYLPNPLNPSIRMAKMKAIILGQETDAMNRPTVMSGIFKGMTYINYSSGSQFYPKILGTYESELYNLIYNRFKDGIYHLVVAGTAEGYFAVGLNIFFDIEKNTFFEADETARKRLHELANSNNFTDYDLFSKCTLSSLADSLIPTQNGFIFMDIEGAEIECLHPTKIDLLKNYTILVEAHDFIVENAGKVLIKRFGGTHNYRIVHAKRKSLFDFPIDLQLLDRLVIKPKYIINLMNESRPKGMYWVYFSPKKENV